MPRMVAAKMNFGLLRFAASWFALSAAAALAGGCANTRSFYE
jgi:hypothetical protein